MRSRRRRPRREAWGLALLGLTGCLDEVPPTWMITDPRILLVEQTVVASGELSTPLALDPPGRARTEGLPGDRVKLRAIFVDADGPFEPEVLWLRSTPNLRAPGDVPLPFCASDGLDVTPVCRLEADELTLPPLAPGQSSFDVRVVTAIASAPGGPPVEECLERVMNLGTEPLFGCLVGTERLVYGPRDRFAELTEHPTVYPPDEPNFRIPEVRLDLEIVGATGIRVVTIEDGGVAQVSEGESITATLAVDESELQGFHALLNGEVVELTEVPYAEWWATAPALRWAVDLKFVAASVPLTIPSGVDGFHLYLNVHDREDSHRWFWVRFEVARPEPGGA